MLEQSQAKFTQLKIGDLLWIQFPHLFQFFDNLQRFTHHDNGGDELVFV